MNWTFLAGFYAGGKSDEEVTVHRVADGGDSEGRGSRGAGGTAHPQARISAATYYHWKSKYAGAGVAELKRLRELEVENSKLKRMYADLALENAAIKEVLNRKL